MKRALTLPFLVSVIALVALAAGPVAAGNHGQNGERVAVFIGFTQQPGPSEEALVRQAGGSIKYTYTLVPAMAAAVPRDAIEGLRNNPRVAYVEPDIEVHIVDHDKELNNTWGVAHIGGGDAHHDGYLGNSVRVAVLDTGIVSHPDLPVHDEACSNATSYDDVDDGHGHGTHVSGTVAALKDGVGVVGAAPAATLCVFNVLSDGGGGSYSDVVAALNSIADFNGDNPDDPIRVTNNSYGSSGDPGQTVWEAFDNTYKAGVLHVAAAGNSGNPPGNGDNCIYPARWDALVATAATTKDNTRASFSSTCQELELSAPGVNINSTWNNGGYREASGTSMASPHVAGTAALAWAANGDLSNVDIRSILQDTAEELGPTGRDKHYCYGLVQAHAAALAAAPAEPEPTGTITGTVTDAEDGTGIADATVSVEGTSLSAITDSNGSYSIPDVPEGTHNVTASAEGYEDSTQEGVSVTKDETTTVDFTLQPVPTGTISGTVTDADTSNGIEGATVSVEGTSLSATTDSNGSYSIPDVPEGTHDVTASAEGYEAETKSVGVTGGEGATADFSLAAIVAADQVKVVSITYSTRGGRNNDKHLDITLALEDEGGNPVSDASVSIDLHRDGSLLTSGTGTTGSDGKVTFTLNNHGSGCYETGVTDVQADGLTWDGETPQNWSEDCKEE